MVVALLESIEMVTSCCFMNDEECEVYRKSEIVILVYSQSSVLLNYTTTV